jgi:hypothetical protein
MPQPVMARYYDAYAAMKLAVDRFAGCTVRFSLLLTYIGHRSVDRSREINRTC